MSRYRSVLGQCKGHNSGVEGFGRLKSLVEILCPPTYSPSLIKTGQKLFDLESETLILDNFGQLKGHYSGVPGGIWLVIKLGQDIMHTNIFNKFDKDMMKTLRLI